MPGHWSITRRRRTWGRGTCQGLSAAGIGSALGGWGAACGALFFLPLSSCVPSLLLFFSCLFVLAVSFPLFSSLLPSLLARPLLGWCSVCPAVCCFCLFLVVSVVRLVLVVPVVPPPPPPLLPFPVPLPPPPSPLAAVAWGCWLSPCLVLFLHC